MKCMSVKSWQAGRLLLSTLRCQTENTCFLVKNRISRCSTGLRYYSSPTEPELTSVRYPKVHRGQFASLSPSDVDFFEKLMPGQGRVLSHPDDDIAGYNRDWIRSVRGNRA